MPPHLQLEALLFFLLTYLCLPPHVQLEALNDAKRRLDPKGILGNTLVDSLLLPDSQLPPR